MTPDAPSYGGCAHLGLRLIPKWTNSDWWLKIWMEKESHVLLTWTKSEVISMNFTVYSNCWYCDITAPYTVTISSRES